MKALFIPLNKQYYEQFVDGSKQEELRRYGVRWNEKTCEVGRKVTLSCGYGSQRRIQGVITRFKKQRGALFGSTYRHSILQVYGTLDLDIACIGIKIVSGEVNANN